MRVLLTLLTFMMSLVTPHLAGANTSNADDINAQFTSVDLSTYILRNQIPEDMAAKKQRLMLPPSGIQFDSQLMHPPKPGSYTLVHDAINLWPGTSPLPDVSHSAFLQASDGRVIGVYVAAQAAKQLQAIANLTKGKPAPCHIYAIHIYNYAKGPRLVVIGATSAQMTKP